MWPRRPDCHTGAVNEIVLRDRWRVAVAALRPLPGRRPSLSARGWLADVLLAVVLAAVGAYGLLTAGGHQPGTTGARSLGGVPAAPAATVGPQLASVPWWPAGLVVLIALALLARRRFPLATLVLVVGLGVLDQVPAGLPRTVALTACVIAACSAVLYSPYQVVATASALVGAGLVIGQYTDTGQPIGPGVLIALLVVAAGFVLPTWRRRVQTIAAEQRAATAHALDRERTRIAQELHDVVTHNVSLMIVQAGAARTALPVAPERAGAALRNVESVGRAAMTELRHIMGLLTANTDNPDQDPDAELVPPPGLAQVAALVDRVRGTGARVELAVSLPPHPLPAGVDLAAYRVVQEALTNVGKHAAGARAAITIEHTPRELRIEVVDTGGVPAATTVPANGAGRGLIGMRERLAMYGGSLHTGKLPTAGFRVCAVIPLELP